MNYFTTQSHLPFLHYVNGQYGLSLRLDSFPLSDPIEFDELFEEVDCMKLIDRKINVIFLANYLANLIAAQTRRGAANIIFCPDENIKKVITSQANYFTCIVDDRLKSNEIRSTYWKARSKLSDEQSHIENPKAVDGGVQFSPEGFSCLPNYKAYFKRGFWED
jgi:hypothetical protein